MKKTLFFAVVSLILIIAFWAVTYAQIPTIINNQGRLLGSSGDPVVDGLYLFKFTLYDDPLSGEILWSSDYRRLQVTNGFYNYLMGDTIPIPDRIFNRYPDVWLGTQVGEDPEIAPRNKISSVGYAYKSLHSDTAKYALRAGYANLAEDAEAFAGETPDFYLNWGDMTNVPAGFADGVDDVGGGGDITGVSAGSGLTGGGVSGDVTLSIPNNGIQNNHIANDAIDWFQMNSNAIGNDEMQNNAIGSAEIIDGSVHTGDIMDGSLFDVDIAILADIAPTKIAGTAVNLIDDQFITGTKTFSNLRVSTTTRRISIPAAAFVPWANIIYYNNGYNLYSNTLGLSDFYAPIMLPDGAIITQVEAQVKDEETGTGMTVYCAVYFREYSVTPTGSIDAFTIASFSTLGRFGYFHFLENLSSPHLINNEDNYYYVEAVLGRISSLGTIALYGVEIEYTITRPLP